MSFNAAGTVRHEFCTVDGASFNNRQPACCLVGQAVGTQIEYDAAQALHCQSHFVSFSVIARLQKVLPRSVALRLSIEADLQVAFAKLLRTPVCRACLQQASRHAYNKRVLRSVEARSQDAQSRAVNIFVALASLQQAFGSRRHPTKCSDSRSHGLLAKSVVHGARLSLDASLYVKPSFVVSSLAKSEQATKRGQEAD